MTSAFNPNDIVVSLVLSIARSKMDWDLITQPFKHGNQIERLSLMEMP